MRLNWIGFDFSPYDGYGRYSVHLIRAMTRLGVQVVPVADGQFHMPGWMQQLAGMNLSRFSIACIPPYMLRNIPGRQWSLSMTEGSMLPDGWAETLNETCERVIVPCDHNQQTFEDSGVEIPIHVIHGGTCPAEFPRLSQNGSTGRPYTFMALADRGSRKGWTEVWAAFFSAFGSMADTPDVRLIVKARPNMNEMFDTVAGATNQDPRVTFWREDVQTMADVYPFADVFAIPSRSEGWGMPHREAAMMGLPVLVTQYSGLDDGNTDKWGIVVRHGNKEPVPAIDPFVEGEWVRPDMDDLTKKMRWCYENRGKAREKGSRAAEWLREHQTWEHSARQLLELIQEHR